MKKVKVNFLANWAQWLVRMLVIQLFLFSLGFPVLVSWGIPFSPLVFLGNLLFTPLLTLFLGIACILYVCQLCALSPSYLYAMLDGLSHAWLTSMKWAPDLPLIACPRAPWWLLCTLPLGSWMILHGFGFKHVYKALLMHICWITFMFGSIKWYFTPHQTEFRITCGAKTIVLSMQKGKVTLVDHEGALHTRACSWSWIEYTLSSELASRCGTTTIDQIITRPARKRSKERIQYISKKYHAKLS